MRVSRSNIEWYVADFETTGLNEYEKTGRTRVWLYAISDSNANIVNYGDSIEKFFEWCASKNNILVYFHNLRFDGTFILNYLLENKFPWQEKLLIHSQRAFTALIGEMGEFYQIKVNFKSNNQVTFQDSLKIIPLKVKEIAEAFNLPIEKEIIDYDDYTIDEKRLHYVFNDVKIVAMALKFFRDKGFNRMTIGSNAYKDYNPDTRTKKSTFPRLDTEWLMEWRGAYRGGRSQCNPKYEDVIMHNVKRYDINSMYPDIMYRFPMPYGYPIPCDKPGHYKFELYKVRICFKIKKGHLPTLLKTGSIYSKVGDTYYMETDGVEEIYISSVDLELVKRHYNVSHLVYEEIYGFKTSYIMFKEWIEKYYSLKSTSQGGLRLVYKLIINNLYGKFGTKCKSFSRIPELSEEGSLIYKKSDEKDMGNYYLPVAIAVTSWAHLRIDDAIMQVGYDNFIYCDTDSIHTIGTLPDDWVDAKELGKFKLESIEIKSKYIRQKCYITYEEGKDGMEWHITCAGMTDSLKEYLVREYGDDVINVFKIGLSINAESPNIRKEDMKLRPKQVPGGTILVPVPYSLK